MSLFKRSSAAAASPAMALVLVAVLICMAVNTTGIGSYNKEPGVIARGWSKWMAVKFGYQLLIILVLSTIIATTLFGK
jgi:hypothetical protein